MQTIIVSQPSRDTMSLPIQIASQVVPIKLKEQPILSEDKATPQPSGTKPATTRLSGPPSRKKQVSEPASSIRRSIFSQFWRGRSASSSTETLADSTETERDSNSPPPPPATVLPTRPRSISVSAIAETPEDARICVEFFSPPVVRSVLDNHDHFLPLDRLVQNQLLPVLPMPLRRFYNEGKSSPLQGMYPLMEPKSILRRKTQMPSQASCTQQRTGEHYQWNFTTTNRHLLPVKKTYAGSSFHSNNAGSESSHEKFSAGLKAVSFDPRVTVTEFEDDVPREWFSEAELDRFRTQTVMRAQAYLMEHPDMIRVYQQPYLDPVTGTMRRKALYSMPCLASDDNDECCSNGDVEKKSSSSVTVSALQARQLMAQQALEVAAKHHVQTILIVDRNKVCLDLFSRSLRHVFPHARIELADSPSKALALFRRELIERKKGFDVVIAEEALNLPLTDTATPLVTGRKSFQLLESSPEASTAAGMEQRVGLHARHESLDGLPPPRSDAQKTANAATPAMTGSELLKRLSREAGMLTVPSHATPQGVVRAMSNPFIPLLIAVSSQPGVEKLEPVDIVWGKPPPIMDKQLRDSMVQKLLAKRRTKAQDSA